MNPEAKELQDIINHTLRQDQQTLAACEALAIKIKEAERKKVYYNPAVHATLAAITKNIEARQKQVKDHEKKVGYATRMAAFPKHFSDYASNVLSKTKNWFSSLWGMNEGLGAAPALVVAVVFTAGAIATAALIQLFRSSERGARLDFDKVKNSAKIFDAAIASGVSPKEVEDFKKDVQQKIDEAYRSGANSSTWGWMKNIGLIGGAILVLSVGLPLLRTELARHQQKRLAA
jgi:hypothetical protein